VAVEAAPVAERGQREWLDQSGLLSPKQFAGGQFIYQR